MVETGRFLQKNGDGTCEMIKLISQSYIHRNQRDYGRRTPDWHPTFESSFKQKKDK